MSVPSRAVPALRGIEDGGKRSKCKLGQGHDTEKSWDKGLRHLTDNVYDLSSETSVRENLHGSSQDGSSERVLADAATLDQEPVHAATCATTPETDAVPESTTSPSAVRTVSGSSSMSSRR